MINVIFNKSEYELSQRKIDMYEKYLKMIQWGRREPVHFMENVFGLQFTDHQRYVLLSTWNTRYAVWLMSRNSGKGIPENDKVWMSDNTQKTIRELQIGDYILDVEHNPTKVIAKSEIWNNDCYDVYFSES